MELPETVEPDTFIPVSEIKGALPQNALTGTELKLNDYVTVAPENATNKPIVWAIIGPDRFGVNSAEEEDGVFTPTLPGLMRLKAVIANGKAEGVDFVKEDYQITLLEPDSFVPVTELTLSLPTEPIFTGTELDLNRYARVEPENASTQVIVWSIENPESFGLSADAVKAGTFTPSKAGDGTMEITATIPKGKGDGDVVKTGVILIQEPLVPVRNIRGVPEKGFTGSFIDLSSAAVEPENATYTSILWSISDAGLTGVSSITGGGFTASSPGTLVLRASVAYPGHEGSYTQDFTVTVGPPPPLSWTKAPISPLRCPMRFRRSVTARVYL